MSAPSLAAVQTAISNRVAYPVATDADVPGTDAFQGDYDLWDLGQRVLVSGNGNRYTKTAMTLYAAGGRITQEDSGGGAAGVDGTYTNLPSAVDLLDAVYLDPATGVIAKADASDTTTAPAFGFVTAILTTTASTVRLLGDVTMSGLAAGAAYYLGTAGAITTTPNAALPVTQYVGRAKADGVTLAAFADPSSALGLYLATNAQNSTDSTFPELTLSHAVTGAGVAAAGIGAALGFRVETATGALKRAGKVRSGFTTITDAAEVGVVEVLPAFAGTYAAAGLRVQAPVTAIVNGFDFIPAAAGGFVQMIPYGSNADVSLVLGGKGAGTTTIAVGATSVVNVSDAAVGTTIASTLVSSLTAAGQALLVNDASNASYTTVQSLSHMTTAAAGAGIGARTTYLAENSVGTAVLAGAIGAQLGVVLTTQEQGLVEVLPAFGGTLAAAGVRVSGTVASQVEGLNVIPATSGADVALTTYGSANSGLLIYPSGTGNAQILAGDLSPRILWGSATGLRLYGTVTMVDGAVSMDGATPAITATTANAGIRLVPDGTGISALRGSAGVDIIACRTVAAVSQCALYNGTPVPQASALVLPTLNAGDVAASFTSLTTYLTALTNGLKAVGGIGVFAG